MSQKPDSSVPPRSRAEQARLKDQIDENLRRVYRETVEEKLPDRFADLLEALRRKEGPK